MKRTTVLSFTIFTLFAVLFSACGKYEDGPAFSLATKKNRVVNTWKIEKVFINDDDKTSLFQVLIDAYKIELTKDGKLTETYTTGLGTHKDHGTWEFDGSKEHIIVTISGSKTSYKILRLTSNEMWLEEIDAGVKYVTHFASYK